MQLNHRSGYWWSLQRYRPFWRFGHGDHGPLSVAGRSGRSRRKTGQSVHWLVFKS